MTYRWHTGIQMYILLIGPGAIISECVRIGLLLNNAHATTAFLYASSYLVTYVFTGLLVYFLI